MCSVLYRCNCVFEDNLWRVPPVVHHWNVLLGVYTRCVLVRLCEPERERERESERGCIFALTKTRRSEKARGAFTFQILIYSRLHSGFSRRNSLQTLGRARARGWETRTRYYRWGERERKREGKNTLQPRKKRRTENERGNRRTLLVRAGYNNPRTWQKERRRSK